MGFNDLALPALDEPQPPAAPAADGKRASKKSVAAASAAAAEAEAAFGTAAPAAAAFEAAASVALQRLDAIPAPASAELAELAAAAGSSKYAPQLARLAHRYKGVLREVLVGPAAQGSSPEEGQRPGEDIDGLAAAAAARSLELRSDVSKGARARKKKAVTDFFKALTAAGVSRGRAAVPAGHRGVANWFKLAGPDVSPLLEGGGLAPAQLAAARAVWSKGDAYYFRSMARLQRLWEVGAAGWDCAPAA